MPKLPGVYWFVKVALWFPKGNSDGAAVVTPWAEPPNALGVDGVAPVEPKGRLVGGSLLTGDTLGGRSIFDL